jgi:solute carrier family 13 (sodium-dependent dicarboxylate transporter), member 2/3/5
MEKRRPWTPTRIALLGIGPLLGAAIFFGVPESYRDQAGDIAQLGIAGRVSAGLAIWMALWWLTEVVPLWATALLPLAVLPVAGAATIPAAARPYLHPLIFLFLGGFVLALSMERWGLHRRFAYRLLRLAGTRPRNLVAAFMGATALLSMWVSNTATAMMMLPIALSVLEVTKAKDGDALAICLLLGIAYGASIGGIGTLIGTPPNLFLASYARDHLGVEISFVRWLGVGLPLVVVFLPMTWLLLTRVLHPLGRDEIGGGAAGILDGHRPGPMSRGERATLVVFLCTAGAWITRPLLAGISLGGIQPLAGLTDTWIAAAGAAVLFVIPTGRAPREFVMDPTTAGRVPWGILILFGGGLSLAAALEANGVGAWLGSLVAGLDRLPGPLLVVAVTAMVIFLTELTTNTATTASLVPILAGVAPGLGVPPLMLVVPAAVAASCAFMMPVATPPNAIVFGSGRLSIRQMARTGLGLNLIGVVLIPLLLYTLGAWVLGIDLGGTR